ncbi:MAG: phospho-N-acetylmuramoyl-pentapeptide-transferase [Gammaproteobacteria bacterium]|nr:phospho-N-acetylmuramoyl-pentapeptide-transferase [Gammaproteobacteria bacterium]
MLVWLTTYLEQYFSFFNVFEYVTFRTIVSSITALLLTLFIGPLIIRQFEVSNIGETIREDGPATHQQKAGTPTMGGLMIVLSVVIVTLLWGDLANRHLWIIVFALFGFALIGLIDDLKKMRQQRGLSVKLKLALQSVLGLAIACTMFYTATVPAETELIIPIFKEVVIPLGLVYIFLTYLMIVGMSNSVNLADGLDGLAILPSVMIAAALGLIAYLVGHVEFSDYLKIPYVPHMGEVAIFCGALVGAGLGFLWFNAYPAQVFMGDIGALAIGAALGTVGVLVRHEVVLLIMSGVFLLESASVVLQVASFKMTGRRVFQMAPLHHHFELKGWPEPRIIVRFWIISFMLVLVGLSMLKLR